MRIRADAKKLRSYSSVLLPSLSSYVFNENIVIMTLIVLVLYRKEDLISVYINVIIVLYI